jgi:hypothetical protein
MDKAIELWTAFNENRPLLAAAYLWTLISFFALCIVMGTIETVKKRKG